VPPGARGSTNGALGRGKVTLALDRKREKRKRIRSMSPSKSQSSASRPPVTGGTGKKRGKGEMTHVSMGTEKKRRRGSFGPLRSRGKKYPALQRRPQLTSFCLQLPDKEGRGGLVWFRSHSEGMKGRGERRSKRADTPEKGKTGGRGRQVFSNRH